jgi:outer membrane protein assembly factor BamB
VVAGGRVFVAAVDAHAAHALEADTGEPAWTFTAGGRIDSPPSVARGRVIFGSADGHVYCLRIGDGSLVWRFRAAPEERRIMAFGQVESAWPVHGSVLVVEGAVYFVAGRSSFLDGGMVLYRLDLDSGSVLARQHVYSRDPETGEQPEEPMMFEMPGALPDVLSTDGKLVYMRHLAFDPQTLEPREPRTHLFSPAGFLNDNWWHRTYWIMGQHFYSGYIGWYFAGREAPAGRLLAYDDQRLYGYSYRPEFYRGSTGRKYHLFAVNRDAQPPQPPADYRRASRDYPARGAGKFHITFDWSQSTKILVRAMVLTDGKLFAAGAPAGALQDAALLEGRRGGLLTAVSTEDGRALREYKLAALPVFDGLAAAGGRLYLSTQDGKVHCLAGAD